MMNMTKLKKPIIIVLPKKYKHFLVCFVIESCVITIIIASSFPPSSFFLTSSEEKCYSITTPLILFLPFLVFSSLQS